ncbi:MAG: AmmeMemoRadiSam system radical SAM enzyme [Clostridiaceae bacterium]|nr:AmmeMemoRadiSam system radical SAM enzyme [Clostridiaceae bacterium]
MNKVITCDLCPRFCRLAENQTGFCKARQNIDGKIKSLTYGKWLSIALDPIEKKPLAYFKQGSMILSVGTFGCNMTCPFCQNHQLARASVDDFPSKSLSPDELVEQALDLKTIGNIGIAFTYNEPLINFEYIRDTAKLARQANLETVVVTSGQINKPYLEELLPLISAWNIDLKSFSEAGYQRLGGDFKTTLETIRLAAEVAHVEITTLVVPKISDDLAEFKQQVDFIAQIEPEIPLHLTRYFPYYKYNEPPTSISLLQEMAKLARKKLNRVKIGNI